MFARVGLDLDEEGFAIPVDTEDVGRRIQEGEVRVEEVRLFRKSARLVECENATFCQ